MVKPKKRTSASKKTLKQSPSVRVPIRRKIVLQSIFLTTLTALTLSLSAFFTTHVLIQQRIFSQLSSLVNAKEELIVRRLNADRERTAILSSREEIINVARGAGGSADLNTLLKAMQEEGVPALGITIFHVSGAVRSKTGLSIDPFASPITATTLEPIQGQEGWDGYTIYSPIGDRGTLAIRYSLREFLSSVFTVPTLGDTGEVLLAKIEGDEIILLNHQYAPGKRSPLFIGSFSEHLSHELPIAQALAEHEDVRSDVDYEGQKVFVAFRQIPAIGWGLAVKVHRSEAMQGIVYMSLALLIKSLLLILLASYAAVVLANRLTRPLGDLTEKMSKLGPKHWKLGRTITSGDEVELLEHIASDMADRLHGLYENLEETVEERTEELKAQFLKEKTILETIDHGVIMVNDKGMITDANPASLAVLKCDSTACKSRNIEDILDIRINHKSVPKAKHPVLVSLKKKAVVRSAPNMRYSIMNNDNILVPVLMIIKPLMEGQKVIGAVAVFQDVTEERRVDYLKSEFISLASHQLRTPLSSLQWYIELINDKKNLNDEQQEYVKEMGTAAKRMSNLIDALLHAARLEGGDITPHKNIVNLTTLMTDLGEELRSMGKKQKISTTVSVPNERVEMETDSVLLHVIFKNLFSNAVKYTPKGGQVSVVMKATKTEVKIEVSDNGIGIPKVAQKRLFQRLFRADNVRKMDTDGNGLGLYISKMIVDSLGGSISAKSIEGKGATFTVKLPIKKKKAAKAKKKKK